MMRAVRRVALVAVLVLTAACSSNDGPAVASTPTVTVATALGSGCPAGTVTTAVVGTTITAVYTAFTAQAGTGVPLAQNRRNCQFNIQIVSPGQRFSVTSVEEHGTISLPAGGTALQSTNYFLQGNSANAPVDHPATGPLSGPWDQTDNAPFAAPCGNTKNLNVNVQLKVASPGPAASLTLNGPTAGTTIHLAFTDCP